MRKTMKLISWNVNGLRACLGKGFTEAFEALDADFFCLQETKLQAGQVTLDLPGYHQFWNYAEKKGYSGTAIFAKKEPLSVRLGLGVPELDTEGRLITLEYENFFLVTCYTPNAQPELARIDHRLRWEDSFRHLYPDVTGAYSWRSYRFHAREKNAGWRIDYFLVSNRVEDQIQEASIHPEIFGSDHCPVELDIDL